MDSAVSKEFPLSATWNPDRVARKLQRQDSTEARRRTEPVMSLRRPYILSRSRAMELLEGRAPDCRRCSERFRTGGRRQRHELISMWPSAPRFCPVRCPFACQCSLEQHRHLIESCATTLSLLLTTNFWLRHSHRGVVAASYDLELWTKVLQ